MMNNFFRQWLWRIKMGWSFMRIFRLILSVILIFQAVVTGEWMFVLLGGFFFFQSIMGIGCCGSVGCEMPPSVKKETT